MEARNFGGIACLYVVAEPDSLLHVLGAEGRGNLIPHNAPMKAVLQSVSKQSSNSEIANRLVKVEIETSCNLPRLIRHVRKRR